MMVDSSAGINFSDPSRGFMADARAVYGGDSDGITSMFKRKFSEESDFDEFGSDFTVIALILHMISSDFVTELQGT